MKYTLYEKIGRKYKPVQEYDSKVMDSLPAGFHLIFVQPGSKSYKFNVEPDNIELMAAAKIMEEGMITALQDESVFKPCKKLTQKQADLYKAYSDSMGPELYSLSRNSAWGIIQKGIEVLLDYKKGERIS